MPIVEFILVIALAATAGILLLKAKEAKQKQQQLQDAFYTLLKSQNSCISLIQLSAAARVDSQLAKDYLEQQIKAFDAMPEVDADGHTLYRFPQL